MKNIDKIDCSEIIQNTSKEVKKLIYKVSKIVCSEDDHIVIDRDEKKEIEIIEKTTIFLKIPV